VPQTLIHYYATFLNSVFCSTLDLEEFQRCYTDLVRCQRRLYVSVSYRCVEEFKYGTMLKCSTNSDEIIFLYTCSSYYMQEKDWYSFLHIKKISFHKFHLNKKRSTGAIVQELLHCIIEVFRLQYSNLRWWLFKDFFDNVGETPLKSLSLPLSDITEDCLCIYLLKKNFEMCESHLVVIFYTLYVFVLFSVLREIYRFFLFLFVKLFANYKYVFKYSLSF